MCFGTATHGRRPIDPIALRFTPIPLPLASARRPRGLARARRRAMPSCGKLALGRCQPDEPLTAWGGKAVTAWNEKKKKRYAQDAEYRKYLQACSRAYYHAHKAGRARQPAQASVWDIACGLRGPFRAAGRRLCDLQAIRAAAVRGSLPRHRLGARSALPQLQHGTRFPAGRSARRDGGGGLSQGRRACRTPP